MRPFSNSALCVGCRTSLRALIRGLANQFKYQRRARRNFISFPISCACVGGFNSVPAPLIPTNSPPPPRRTVTHLFAQKNAINVAVFRCTHYLRLYYCHQLLPIILVLFPISFRPHSYRSISCACSTGVRRMLRRHDVRLRYISWKCTGACAHPRSYSRTCVRVHMYCALVACVDGITPAVVRFTTPE